MKKLIVYFIAIVLMLPVLNGCEDFLDTTNYTEKDSNSFPRNEKDANLMLNGVYVMLNVSGHQAMDSWFFLAELASDDRFGAGGRNDIAAQAISHLMYSSQNQFKRYWEDRYRGISRATEAIDALETMDEGDLKNQKLGEAKYLRAHFYFELVQLLGDVPLIKELPKDVTQTKDSPPQAKAEDVLKFIASDLWEAYSMMPSIQYNDVLSGTVTKWAAAALLARVYLFYTGFFSQTSLITEGGETLTNATVAAALQDCMDNSGHSLLPDYRSLWPYTNVLTKPDYAFAADAPDWVEGSNNPEVIFAIKHNALGGWGSETTTGYSNSVALYFGVRDASRDSRTIFPMGGGWGIGTVNPNTWDEWPDADPRKRASIYNITEEGTGTFVWGMDTHMEETGMWQKKVIAITAYGGTQEHGLYNNFWSAPQYGNRANDDFQLGHGTDLILIRYADVLLMHSELTGTAEGMTEVRARVGLAPVTYSLENLQAERRWEFAFEGLRWGDIRRWGIAADVLQNNVYGAPIYNLGTSTDMKPQGSGLKARYEATKGFFNIPFDEIQLSNGALVQNPGWDASANYSSWIGN